MVKGKDTIGNCYQIHLETLQERRWEHDGIKDTLLVHGLVTGQGKIKGTRYGHAWLEVGGMIVFDISNGRDVVMSVQDYYELGKIKEEEIKRYSLTEAQKLITRTGHYGPWHHDIDYVKDKPSD